MKTKIKKLLFEYSKNSRITTRELGKLINTSQQSASYLLNSLKKRKLIEGSVTIIDPVKLGFVNVIVGFNFLDYHLIKEIIDELKQIPEITSVEEGNEGLDLLVEYTTSNLSAFNKIHSELIYKFYKKLRTAFVFPIIVSHGYNKNYLSNKFDNSDIILYGDRSLRELSKNEQKILDELVKYPDIKIVDISENLKIPVKSVVKLKKSLERKYIIKGYSSILNHKKLGIDRQIIFLRFSSEDIRDIDKFYDFTRNNRNIIRFIKIIGEYQLAIFVESLKDIEIIKDIRANFPIENYLIIKSERIHKRTYLPLLQ